MYVSVKRERARTVGQCEITATKNCKVNVLTGAGSSPLATILTTSDVYAQIIPAYILCNDEQSCFYCDETRELSVPQSLLDAWWDWIGGKLCKLRSKFLLMLHFTS